MRLKLISIDIEAISGEKFIFPIELAMKNYFSNLNLHELLVVNRIDLQAFPRKVYESEAVQRAIAYIMDENTELELFENKKPVDRQIIINHSLGGAKTLAVMLLNLKTHREGDSFEDAVEAVMAAVLHKVKFKETMMKDLDLEQSLKSRTLAKIVRYSECMSYVHECFRSSKSIETASAYLQSTFKDEYDALFYFADVLDSLKIMSHKYVTKEELYYFKVVSNIALSPQSSQIKFQTPDYGFEYFAETVDSTLFMTTKYDEYKYIRELIEYRYDKKREVLEDELSKNEVLLRLIANEAGIEDKDMFIDSRIKHAQSLSKKLKKGSALDEMEKIHEVKDILAWRIIVKDNQQLIRFLEQYMKRSNMSFQHKIGLDQEHSVRLYCPAEPKNELYKYVLKVGRNPENPSNPYEAVHINVVTTKAEDKLEIVGEIQIRTYEGQREAEFGKAKHRIYKGTSDVVMLPFEDTFKLQSILHKDRMQIYINFAEDNANGYEAKPILVKFARNMGAGTKKYRMISCLELVTKYLFKNPLEIPLITGMKNGKKTELKLGDFIAEGDEISVSYVKASFFNLIRDRLELQLIKNIIHSSYYSPLITIKLARKPLLDLLIHCSNDKFQYDDVRQELCFTGFMSDFEEDSLNKIYKNKKLSKLIHIAKVESEQKKNEQYNLDKESGETKLNNFVRKVNVNGIMQRIIDKDRLKTLKSLTAGKTKVKEADIPKAIIYHYFMDRFSDGTTNISQNDFLVAVGSGLISTTLLN